MAERFTATPLPAQYDGGKLEQQFRKVQRALAGLVPITRPYTTVDSAYTIQVSDDTIMGDATPGPFTITLPLLADCPGQMFTVKKVDGGADAITVDGNGAEAVEYGTSVTLALPGDTVVLQNVGTAWIIVSFYTA